MATEYVMRKASELAVPENRGQLVTLYEVGSTHTRVDGI